MRYGKGVLLGILSITAAACCPCGPKEGPGGAPPWPPPAGTDGLVALRPKAGLVGSCEVAPVAPICVKEPRAIWAIENGCATAQKVVLYKFFGVTRNVGCGMDAATPCPEKAVPLDCYMATKVGASGNARVTCELGEVTGCWKYDVYLGCDPRMDANCTAALDPDLRRPPTGSPGEESPAP